MKKIILLLGFLTGIFALVLAGCGRDADMIIDARSEKIICEVHNQNMQEGTAYIKYGLVCFDADYRDAKKTLFPNSHSFLLGGCCWSDDFLKRAKVRYCPACRQEEQAWR